MSTGILVACYVMLSYTTTEGRIYGWMDGVEIGQKGDKILFVGKNREAEYVNNNDCKYLEDPVPAYEAWLANKELWDKELMQEKQKIIDARTVGSKPWCLVREYGQRNCAYTSMRECLLKVDKLSYCESK